MKKRILAVVLCVAMLLSVVPFTLTAGAALATDDTAKIILDVPDAGGKIAYNNAHSDTAWGISRWTNETDGWVSGSSSVTEDGENFFPFKIPDNYSNELFKEGASKNNFSNNYPQHKGKAVVKRGIAFLPATYMLDVCYDAKDTTVVPGGKHEGQLYGEQPLSAYVADAADYNYVVYRFKVSGGAVGKASPLALSVGGSGNSTLTDVTTVDIKTGEVVKYTSGTTMKIPYNFNGYIIVGKSTFKDQLQNAKRFWFNPWMTSKETNWDGETLYFGDMMIVKDISAFLQVHAAPIFSLESNATSVTVKGDDAAALFSTDASAEDSAWLTRDQINSTLTALGADKKVTIYAKYAGGTNVTNQTIWTSPYSTHNGDGAYYIMNVHDDASYNSYISYKAEYNLTNIRDMGWPSSTFAKNAFGAYESDSSFGRLEVKSLDGETFLEYDRRELTSEGDPDTSCGNQSIATSAITKYNAEPGLHSSVDTTGLKYVAVRMKVVEDTPGTNATRMLYLFAGGYESATATAATDVYQATTWEGAYFIDKATGAITPFVEAKAGKKDLTLTGDFDGWFVFPMTAYRSGEYLFTKGLTSVNPFLHGTTCHDKLGAGWTDAKFYLGDIVVFASEDQFKSVHVCGAAGHVEETAATCNKKATCSVCKQSYGDVDADAHGTNTELRDVVIADCQQPGYTGDTWCKDCNTKIGTGTPVEQGTCADKDGKWETDGTYHWHTCACGAILDKVAHSGGTATCTDQAVCEICQVGYGELDDDNHCDKDAEYEFDANEHFYTCDCGDTFANEAHTGGTATCKDKAICKVCKQPYGEVNAKNHVGETELRDVAAAECGKEGYTGDTYCKDCDTKIADGEKIEATGNHTEADELANVKEATATEKGYTGDKVCKDCGTIMEKGEDIPVLAGDGDEDDDDNNQTPGGDAGNNNAGDNGNAGVGDDTNQTPGSDNAGNGDNAGAGSGNDGSASPDTGDNASILVAVLMALMAGAVLALSKKRAVNK